MKIIETNLNFSKLDKRKATNRIILHHTAVQTEQSVEVIHNYHKNSLNYAGIGYHFYVRKNGEIFRGRPEDTIGAHAYGSNSDSIGICAEGNFEKETMSAEQRDAIVKLVKYLTNKYNITKIQGHKDVNKTSCPGKNYPFEEIIDGVNKKEVQETKSIVDLAHEVINGKYGVGQERKDKLGSLYNEVQAKVNEILLGKKVENKKSNEEIAKEVLKGEWGNGEDRKNRLTKAGYSYIEVQTIVNKLLK